MHPVLIFFFLIKIRVIIHFPSVKYFYFFYELILLYSFLYSVPLSFIYRIILYFRVSSSLRFPSPFLLYSIFTRIQLVSGALPLFTQIQVPLRFSRAECFSVFKREAQGNSREDLLFSAIHADPPSSLIMPHGNARLYAVIATAMPMNNSTLTSKND